MGKQGSEGLVVQLFSDYWQFLSKKFSWRKRKN